MRFLALGKFAQNGRARFTKIAQKVSRKIYKNRDAGCARFARAIYKSGQRLPQLHRARGAYSKAFAYGRSWHLVALLGFAHVASAALADLFTKFLHVSRAKYSGGARLPDLNAHA